MAYAAKPLVPGSACFHRAVSLSPFSAPYISLTLSPSHTLCDLRDTRAFFPELTLARADTGAELSRSR